jgi:uncharacterized protein (TIGR00299 family) protein
MKTLYLDIFSGISGDMLIGALIDLGVDADALERELRKLRLEGWHLHVARGEKMGISGVKFDVHDHAHEDTHTHEPSHGALTHSHPHSHAHAQTHGQDGNDHEHTQAHGEHEHDHEHKYGPHSGPLVAAGKGHVELSVFETNVPPRFRLYFFDAAGKSIQPPPVRSITLETVRAKNKRQKFKFTPHGSFLEATDELPEPHEFKAILKVRQGGRTQKVETEFIEAHHREHGHGRNFAEIKELISQSALSAWVKQKSVAVFQRIAEAEGKIHGKPPARVHFHEVGAVDSIVDIVGACIGLEMLGKPRVLAAPVVEGVGWVNCAHGRFPIPAPATLAILGARGAGVTQTDEPHELVTPTGAALLAEFAESFGPMSGLVAERIGFGLGTRDNQTRPNVLRAVLGSQSRVQSQKSRAPSADSRVRSSNSKAASAADLDWQTDRVAVLETNLDDLKAEILGYFVERALAAGALDVFHTPIQMKKNRPGILLTVLCAEAEGDKFAEMMLRETSAFGVRCTIAERRKLRREFSKVNTPYGSVTMKIGKLNGRVVQVAPEFESCRKLAERAKVPLKKIFEAADRAIRSKQ